MKADLGLGGTMVLVAYVVFPIVYFNSYDREEVKQVGVYDGAVIERHVESFGRAKGGYVVTMPEGYVCVGDESLDEKMSEYDIGVNKDGIEVRTGVGVGSLSIDVSKSSNRKIIEKDLGYEVISSSQLEPYKRKCLRAIIGYNAGGLQE